MKYLLDTCVISELVKKRPSRRVMDWVSSREESTLFLSVITLGEIRRGVEKLPEGKKKRSLEAWIDTGLKRRFTGRLLPINDEMAEHWGVLAAAAEARGRKLPVLDGLLAASARVASLTFVTRDVGVLEQTGVDIMDPWV